MNKYNYLEVCSGCGGLSYGLELSGLNPYALYEIDKHCIKTLKKNFKCENIFESDIKKVDFTKYKNKINIVVGGIPCFIAGTKVLTFNGYKNIEDVLLNDKLLTHMGKYQKIINLQQKQYTSDLINIKIKHHSEIITCTPEHPFYVRKQIKIWNNEKKKYNITYDIPAWIPAKELNTDYYFSMIINNSCIIPEFTIKKKINQSEFTNIVVKLDKKEQWFTLGYFVGDGWILNTKKQNNKSTNLICFAINNNDEDRIVKIIHECLPIVDKKTNSGKSKLYGCHSIEWFNILKEFGKYAHNKIIPEWVHDAPKEFIEYFINGYISADGYINTEKNIYRITTVSYNLAYSLQRLYLKLGYITSIYKTIRKDKHILCGRIVNQRYTYQVQYYKNQLQNISSFIEDNYVWFKPIFINNNKTTAVNTVYNFEVENDNSYIVENTIVHNCQSFSIAGKRKGLDDEDKGGLFYDFLRILDEIEPDMFMIENVEGLKNINGGETFKQMIKELENKNYDIYYKVLDSRYFNVPQKRRRLIIIGTTLNIPFKFPKEFDKILTMKDALFQVPKSDGIKYSEKKEKIMKLVPPGGCWVDLPENIKITYMGNSLHLGGGKRGIARRISWDEPCLTLTTSPCQKQTERCHPDETRPLTIREYARIQTFPDDFIFEGSISNIYKQIGNAVPCMLAYYIGYQIKKTLDKIVIKKLINNLLNRILLNDNICNIDMDILIKQFYINNIIKIYEEQVDRNKTKIDEIKKESDKIFYNLTDEEWLDFDNKRLKDKQINNKIGELHEYLLSNCSDFCKSNNIDKSLKVDVMKKDYSIFIEVKNKYNTMNASSRESTINKLKKIKEKYPNSICLIGIINGKNYIKQINNEPDIFEYSGEELFNLIFNDKNYYKNVRKTIKKSLKLWIDEYKKQHDLIK